MISAELMGVEEDERRNIVIWIAFSKDGVDYEFYQGATLLEFGGRKVWPLYATWKNFFGKTNTQKIEWIKINVEDQIDNIIKGVICVDTFVDQLKSDISTLIGQTIQKDTLTLDLDLDNDAVVDATVQLKDDGTYTIL